MQCFAHFSLFCALKSRVMKKNIVIFASGSGSNAENIIRYFQKNDSAQVSLVLSNKSDAYVLERAHRLGVPCNVFTKEDWIAGDEILAVLQEYRIDFIVLAGFLVRVPDLLLHAYPDKIINIHPALLPKFGGKGMYGDRVHQAVVVLPPVMLSEALYVMAPFFKISSIQSTLGSKSGSSPFFNIYSSSG